MAFLFQKKTKPADLVKTTKTFLNRLWEPPYPPKTHEELVRLTSSIKSSLQDHATSSGPVLNPDPTDTLVASILSESLLYEFAKTIHLQDLGVRKDVAAIFSYMLRYKFQGQAPESAPPAIDFLVNKAPETIILLCRGYEHQESFSACGVALREALKEERVAACILYVENTLEIEGSQAVPYDEIDLFKQVSGNGIFWSFFDWADKGSFELSSDAFSTLRTVLTKHKQLVARFLQNNFDLFFSTFNEKLVMSESYVIKRQSIKLLGEILLDRANYNVMTEYVDREEHLKICMRLLRDRMKMVQYEGFHVFKVFVANPHKSPGVAKILVTNRERLLQFLPGFLADRTEDEQFNDEKSFLIRSIENLPTQVA